MAGWHGLDGLTEPTKQEYQRPHNAAATPPEPAQIFGTTPCG